MSAGAVSGADDEGDEFAIAFCFLLLVFFSGTSNLLPPFQPLGLVLQDSPAMHVSKLPLLLVFSLEQCTCVRDLQNGYKNN